MGKYIEKVGTASKCTDCNVNPETDPHGGGLKITCPKCGFSVSYPVNSGGAFEAWNRMQMNDIELIEYASRSLSMRTSSVFGWARDFYRNRRTA